MLAFVTSVRTYDDARRTRRYLERQGVPIEVRSKRDKSGYLLFTYPTFQAQVNSLRINKSA
jgi:hypothetical protein